MEKGKGKKGKKTNDMQRRIDRRMHLHEVSRYQTNENYYNAYQDHRGLGWDSIKELGTPYVCLGPPPDPDYKYTKHLDLKGDDKETKDDEKKVSKKSQNIQSEIPPIKETLSLCSPRRCASFEGSNALRNRIMLSLQRLKEVKAGAIVSAVHSRDHKSFALSNDNNDHKATHLIASVSKKESEGSSLPNLKPLSVSASSALGTGHDLSSTRSKEPVPPTNTAWRISMQRRKSRVREHIPSGAHTARSYRAHLRHQQQQEADRVRGRVSRRALQYGKSSSHVRLLPLPLHSLGEHSDRSYSACRRRKQKAAAYAFTNSKPGVSNRTGDNPATNNNGKKNSKKKIDLNGGPESPDAEWRTLYRTTKSRAIQLEALKELNYFAPTSELVRKAVDSRASTALMSQVVKRSLHDPTQTLARCYANFDLCKSALKERLLESLQLMDRELLPTVSEKFRLFDPRFSSRRNQADISRMRSQAELRRRSVIMARFSNYAWFDGVIDKIKARRSGAPTPEALKLLYNIQHMIDKSKVSCLTEPNFQAIVESIKDQPDYFLNADVQYLLKTLQVVFALSDEAYHNCLARVGVDSHDAQFNMNRKLMGSDDPIIADIASPDKTKDQPLVVDSVKLKKPRKRKFTKTRPSRVDTEDHHSVYNISPASSVDKLERAEHSTIRRVRRHHDHDSGSSDRESNLSDRSSAADFGKTRNSRLRDDNDYEYQHHHTGRPYHGAGAETRDIFSPDADPVPKTRMLYERLEMINMEAVDIIPIPLPPKKGLAFLPKETPQTFASFVSNVHTSFFHL